MTPAENPRAMDKKRVFVFFAKKAMALPTPVASPANMVSPNANKTESEGILVFLRCLSVHSIELKLINQSINIYFEGVNMQTL